MPSSSGRTGERRLYTWVHRTLLWGTVCSLVLLLLGLVLWGIAGAEEDPLAVSLGQAMSQILNFKPLGIIALGILVVMATPLVRVVLALIIFWADGDRRYALISLIALSLSFLGLLLAAIF